MDHQLERELSGQALNRGNANNGMWRATGQAHACQHPPRTCGASQARELHFPFKEWDHGHTTDCPLITLSGLTDPSSTKAVYRGHYNCTRAAQFDVIQPLSSPV